MVEFGKRLQEECEQHGEDWQRHCIDYNTLKSIIVESKPKSKQTQLSSTSPTNITTKHSKNRSRTISFDARNNLLLALATTDEDDWEDQDGASCIIQKPRWQQQSNSSRISIDNISSTTLIIAILIFTGSRNRTGRIIRITNTGQHCV